MNPADEAFYNTTYNNIATAELRLWVELCKAGIAAYVPYSDDPEKLAKAAFNLRGEKLLELYQRICHASGFDAPPKTESVSTCRS